MVFKTYEDGSEFTGKHAAFVIVAGSAIGAISFGLGQLVGKSLEKLEIRRMGRETEKVKQMTEKI